MSTRESVIMIDSRINSSSCTLYFVVVYFLPAPQDSQYFHQLRFDISWHYGRL